MPVVKYFATLREITGKRQERIGNVKSVRELISVLSERYGKRFKDELTDRAMILVNGKNIVHLRGLDTEIGDDDEISIFPPVGGG